MSIGYIIVSAIILVLCVVLVGVILMQSKNASGLTGAISGMGGGNAYWDKNKGRSLEGQLNKYTKIIAGILFVLILGIKFLG
ncbi:MAG: preprotein translocase subunit SecG [Firmicutes bacterium]|nr:preprotein translocase subunit SecG [Bacillota bacterium]